MRFIIFFIEHFFTIIKTYKNWHLVFFHLQRFFYPKDYLVKLRNGLCFHVRSGVEDIMVLNEVFAYDVYHKPEAGCEVLSGDRVIDIGSYLGDFSIYAAQKSGDNGFVFAFEPIPELHSILKKNCKANNFRNIRSYNVGLGNKNEKTFFKINSKFTGAASSEFVELQIIDNNLTKNISVEMVNVEDFFIKNDIKKADVIKIDAEGAEYKLLPSLPHSLIESCRCMMIEYHELPKKGMVVKKITNFLDKKGFKYLIEPHENADNIGMIYASKIR